MPYIHRASCVAVHMHSNMNVCNQEEEEEEEEEEVEEEEEEEEESALQPFFLSVRLFCEGEQYKEYAFVSKPVSQLTG